MASSDCPTDDRLREFDRGDMPDDEIDAVAAHIGECPRCVERLAGLAVPVGGFPPASAEVPDDLAYRRAVAHAAFHPVPHPRLPEVGDTLRDYRLVEEVGHGGMGTVFKAVHAKLDKVVAVKVLSGKRWHDPAAVARFEREVKAVGRLSHPNIVQATDAGDADGVPFLVMEFVDGETLAALVRRGGPLPLSEACGLIRQAAAGLHHGHQAGIIHRDVKPSNLMLAKDGTVKVLDLGLALPLAEPGPAETGAGSSTDTGSDNPDLTSASQTVGTIYYMAPEQKRNAHAVDARADVYGLGATLWHLLAGRPPRLGDAASPGVLPGRLPADFWKQFLAPNPAERFPNVEAAVGAMDQAVTPQPRPRRTGLIAALAVVVGVPVALAVFHRPAPVPPAAPAPVLPPPAAGALPMTPDAARQLQNAWADHLRRPAREMNDIGLTLALIPPGQLDLALNARFIVSNPYLIGTTEVTKQQFAAFVTATGHKTDVEARGNGERVVFVVNPGGRSGGTRSTRDPTFDWRNPGSGDAADDDPVTQVSWNDAGAFCDWLSKKEGRTYRLPTEVEWFWAARAGDARDEVPNHPRGDEAETLWQAVAQSPMRPHPVGRDRPNAWGLHDTTDNVTEWCRDWWGAIPPGVHTDYENRVVSVAGIRVLKGRSFVDTSYHYDWRQGYLPHGGRTTIGFRVVCEVP